jgi:hypothetical protein
MSRRPPDRGSSPDALDDLAPSPADIAPSPADIAAWLGAYWKRTGQARYRHAARLVLGDEIGGRPANGDGAAMRRVVALVSAGMDERKACVTVAQESAPPAKVRATTYRLARKLRQKNRHKTGFVPPRSS